MDRKRIAAVALALASIVITEAFGWGLGRALDWLAGQGGAIVHWSGENIGGSIGIALAVASIVVLFWPGARRPGRAEILAEQVRKAINYVGNAQSTADFVADYDLAPALAEANAVRVSLEKAGFVTPTLAAELGPKAKLHAFKHYLNTIEPMLRSGHLKEAKENASRACAEIETTPI